jgi:hypothetical protein
MVETIPLSDEFPDSFHLIDLGGALQWSDHSSTCVEKMRSDPAANITGLILSSLGEPFQNIPPPGDILWQCALDQKWDWFENIVRRADPCAIVFDTILDGYGKYMGIQFGIPAYGTCPVPLGQGFDNEIFSSFWAKRTPPGAFRTAAAARLTAKLRSKGMIQEDAKYDLHGADLTHSDYTFCFSSELMEGKTYDEYRRKGVHHSKIVFVGRDYSAELESGTLRKEDRDFLDDIKANRLSLDSNRKLVFISLGTQAQQPRYFNEYVMDALGGSNITVVLQLSSGTQVTDEEFESWRRRAPSNFVIYAACKPHACLMHLLREADLFISHVGRNSLMEAISQGTPMLALPVSGDQYDNAKVVASEGLGQAFGTGESPADLIWKAIVNNGRWTEEPSSDLKAEFVCLIKEAVRSLLGNDDLQAVVQDKRKLAAGLGFDVARDIILGAVDPADHTS